MQETIKQATPAPASNAPELMKVQTPTQRTIRRLLRNRSAQVGMVMLAALVVMSPAFLVTFLFVAFN